MKRKELLLEIANKAINETIDAIKNSGDEELIEFQMENCGGLLPNSTDVDINIYIPELEEHGTVSYKVYVDGWDDYHNGTINLDEL